MSKCPKCGSDNPIHPLDGFTCRANQLYQLQARIIELEGVLREVEFIETDECFVVCPMCDCRKPDHEKDCRLAAVLMSTPSTREQNVSKSEEKIDTKEDV